MNQIVATIDRGSVPILQYTEAASGRMEVEVTDHKPHMDYATISHVWADGYGNPEQNKLWKCQLDFFDHSFKKAQEHTHRPLKGRFWIDTLALPVDKDLKKYRKDAIAKIHEIYTKATYTIVIDNGLRSMIPGTTYEGVAMKILASGWMRRLWTFQEAYLSRRLLFAFKERNLRELDQLEEDYPLASDMLTSNIPSAARNYFHNLLGPDRKARVNDIPNASGFGLLASVWRAAQWRTTSHPEHETLALATLLNVDYRGASFSTAGFLPDSANVEPTTTNEANGKSSPALQQMMKDLWLLLDRTCPGSIPPGMIFLPGPRLSIEGFGWAPITWMSGKEVDFPDPLASTIRRTSLGDKGLLVQYPGFLLHAVNKSVILQPHNGVFSFPIDNTLLEWYTVEQADEDAFLAPIETKDLAIILCRQRPREVPEIALLVEIEDRIVQRNLETQRRSTIYQALILSRVTFKREVSENQLKNRKTLIRDSQGREDTMICGEVLDDDQKWYVDSRPDTQVPLHEPVPLSNTSVPKLMPSQN